MQGVTAAGFQNCFRNQLNGNGSYNGSVLFGCDTVLFRLLPTVVRLRNVEVLLHITIFFAIVILMDVIQSRERKWS